MPLRPPSYFASPSAQALWSIVAEGEYPTIEAGNHVTVTLVELPAARSVSGPGWARRVVAGTHLLFIDNNRASVCDWDGGYGSEELHRLFNNYAMDNARMRGEPVPFTPTGRHRRRRQRAQNAG
jgi:hypothetical protein